MCLNVARHRTGRWSSLLPNFPCFFPAVSAVMLSSLSLFPLQQMCRRFWVWTRLTITVVPYSSTLYRRRLSVFQIANGKQTSFIPCYSNQWPLKALYQLYVGGNARALTAIHNNDHQVIEWPAKYRAFVTYLYNSIL